MKFDLLKQSTNILLGICISTNVLLYLSIDKLPAEINTVISNGLANIKTQDTVTVTKTASLGHKGNFVYFEGKVKENSVTLESSFTYDPSFPDEIWDGYITYVVSNDGGEYFVWSEVKIAKTDDPLKGWFMTDNLASFQHGKAYLQMLYPIVGRKQNKESI